tara:strand:- start:677 stop:1207 length:531 start_codon:yes stop_codon:yes gene_type:complete
MGFALLSGAIVVFVTNSPVLEIEIQDIDGKSTPFSDSLTTFPMAIVILDPYTLESSWIIDTASRILTHFQGADVRPAFLISGSSAEGAATFLGPLTKKILSLVDENRDMVKELSIESLPAFVVIRQDGSVLGSVEGWDPKTWRSLAEDLAELTSWSTPEIPALPDPSPYKGTPALA